MLEGGNAVRFSLFVFLCLVRRLLLFFCRSSFQGRCLKKFSGANFCFRVSVLFLCFLVGFCLGFCFTFWRFVPESVRKNSLDVRSAVFEKIFGSELLF